MQIFRQASAPSTSAEGFRSAPYFDVQIDGITLLDNAF